MTNGFAMHGIKHVSPSSLNSYAAAQALWVMERLLKRSSPVGCAAHRGSAIEHGVTIGLLDPKAPVEYCQVEAVRKFDTLAALNADPKRADEREAVAPTVAVALAELRQYGVPDMVQVSVTHHLPDIAVPFLGYLDFGWSDLGIIMDLKTTLRIPSDIAPNHARQVALYVHDTNFQARVGYFGPKKMGVYPLDNPGEHLDELRQIAIRLERFLALSADATTLADLVVPEYGSFYWNNPTTRAAGREVFGW